MVLTRLIYRLIVLIIVFPLGMLHAQSDDPLPAGLEHIFVANSSLSGAPTITSLAFSPDGRYMVASGTNPGGLLYLWDIKSGEMVRKLQGKYDEPSVTLPDLEGVTFSPDSKLIAASAEAGYIYIWDVETGEIVLRQQAMTPSVAFSPTGDYLLTANKQHELILSILPTGGAIRKLSGHQDKITSAVFSPNGLSVLAGSEDKTVLFWDIATGEIIQKLSFDAPVSSIAINPRDRQALVGLTRKNDPINSYRDNVTLWDLQKGGRIRSYYGAPPSVISTQFSPDGTLIFANTDEGTVVWDTTSGDIVREFIRGRSAAFSTDGRFIAIGTSVGTIELWYIG